jgi:hypothetical protein
MLLLVCRISSIGWYALIDAINEDVGARDIYPDRVEGGMGGFWDDCDGK